MIFYPLIRNSVFDFFLSSSLVQLGHLHPNPISVLYTCIIQHGIVFCTPHYPIRSLVNSDTLILDIMTRPNGQIYRVELSNFDFLHYIF